ncbi:DNA-binding NarL/FixJ family response regulator [Diaminobutyricimonas aerilata]|uniref:DNA-binding NarL/FixJ family response regulator n=1 Tax=Diaminobutyricimonas aerilata TaxID=1162967 RepID=A0A2M9CKR7_9MICO|nr:response regulator transcription factor [Diaminobutyricimonas aerilata]PJJ72459.1 DNA-binding NarL/FixJ family response regulator [Diaminobutyricimonas aerilata]
MTVRVAIVDDDPLVVAGLRLMLGGASDLEVVGDASDGDELAALVDRTRPAVVLLDIRMARVDGVSALRGLRRSHPSPPGVLVLTTFRTDELVLDALRAGADGFLLKHSDPARIVEAIRAVAAGEPIVSPEVLGQLIRFVADGSGGAAEHRRGVSLDVLTDREREVADAVAEGLGNAEIAQRLHLSLGSVKAHISSALTRLGLDNRVQLAIAAHDARAR